MRASRFGVVVWGVLAVASVAAVVGCHWDFNPYGPCFDPDPDWTEATSCRGDALVLERFRGSAHCESQITTQKDCAKFGQNCVMAQTGATPGANAFCGTACTKDADCGTSGRCAPELRTSAGGMACGTYAQLGEPCTEGVTHCAPGLVCASQTPVTTPNGDASVDGDVQDASDAGGVDGDWPDGTSDPCSSMLCPKPGKTVCSPPR